MLDDRIKRYDASFGAIIQHGQVFSGRVQCLEEVSPHQLKIMNSMIKDSHSYLIRTKSKKAMNYLVGRQTRSLDLEVWFDRDNTGNTDNTDNTLLQLLKTRCLVSLNLAGSEL